MAIKKEPMKHTGVRFSQNQEDAIKAYMKEDETGRTNFSDVVRHAVNSFFNLDQAQPEE